MTLAPHLTMLGCLHIAGLEAIGAKAPRRVEPAAPRRGAPPPPRRRPAAPARAAAAPVDTAASSAAACAAAAAAPPPAAAAAVGWQGVHHVALLVTNLERSLAFYAGLLGLAVHADRPHAKLPFRGAYLMVGADMVHLMELPSPDPTEGRPEHGGRDRHFCVGVRSVDALAAALDAAGVPYTRSKSGRPALFFRDPDANVVEAAELEPWR